jgi:hypothetical protein
VGPNLRRHPTRGLAPHLVLLQLFTSCHVLLTPFCAPSWQGSKVVLHPMDAEEPEVSEHRVLPDTQFLAELPKVCLQVRYPPGGSLGPQGLRRRDSTQTTACHQAQQGGRVGITYTLSPTGVPCQLGCLCRSVSWQLLPRMSALRAALGNSPATSPATQSACFGPWGHALSAQPTMTERHSGAVTRLSVHGRSCRKSTHCGQRRGRHHC